MANGCAICSKPCRQTKSTTKKIGIILSTSYRNAIPCWGWSPRSVLKVRRNVRTNLVRVFILYTHFKHISNNTYSAHTFDICTYFTCIQYFPGCINLAGTKLSAGSKIVRGQTFHTVVQVGHNARVLYTDQDIDGAEGEDMPYLCKLSPGERPLHTMHMIK